MPQKKQSISLPNREKTTLTLDTHRVKCDEFADSEGLYDELAPWERREGVTMGSDISFAISYHSNGCPIGYII